jgi:predicted DNA-binding helix-hairpin-helix protein
MQAAQPPAPQNPVTRSEGNYAMDAIERLKLLSSQMRLEPSEDLDIPEMGPCSRLTQAKQDAVVVSQAVMPNGQRIKLLKTLLTSACERNCFYCPFRAGRDYRRATFKPEEFAHTFMKLHQKDIAEGIFLSSGVVNGGVNTEDQLIAPCNWPTASPSILKRLTRLVCKN